MTSALTRQMIADRLVGNDPDLLVVTGLGGTAWDASRAGDRELTYYLWGGMGLAASMGLGLALSRPDRRVLVLTGDGEMLMGLGSLATVARAAPTNLAIVVVDNELYGETGGQMSHTAGACDLAAVARATGIADSRLVSDAAELEDVAGALRTLGTVRQGPVFAVVRVPGQLSGPPAELPPRDGTYLKHRFREALMGSAVLR
ncbi:MAG: thiamine pyrophosphate-dependent enzyme [Rhodospirillales bacterium]|nr:thiamine pyrophosphate-dependent enzyme [Rhodospirillales bacterium]MDE0711629.1 thiamine pyrophosphate-dependent enzyme [Rhodospirillales bacterium]